MNTSTATGRPSSQVVLAALAASCAPLLLLLSNTDWFFTREASLDPWSYVGLFHRYLDPDYLPEDYKIARLPWILTGFVVTNASSPVTASYVLHGLCLCGAALALFVSVQLLFGRPMLSAIVAMCFGFYTPGHGSGGWDYHNTASGAFYLATVALSVTPSAIGGRPLPLLAVGVGAALAVHANVTFVNLLPALLYVHVCVVRARNPSAFTWRSVGTRLLWATLGVLAGTAVLASINWLAGRDPVFFSRLIDLVALYLTDARFQAGRPLFRVDWVLTARHLALPLAVFVAGAWYLVTRRRRPGGREESMASALVAQFMAMAVLWSIWQSAGHTALDWDYMAYGLIPSCFLALAGLLHRPWPEWCERRWVITLLAAMVVLTAGLSLGYIPGAQPFAIAIQSFVLIAACAIFLVPLAAYLVRPTAAVLAFLIVAYSFGNRVVSPGGPDYFANDPCKVQPAVYGAIVDAATWIMKVDPIYARARTWFDENELLEPRAACRVRLGHVANSFTTMASVGYVAPAFPLPAVDRVPDAPVTALSGEMLVIVSRTPQRHLDAWTRRLGELGLGYSEIATHTVPLLDTDFTMHAWNITPSHGR